MKFYTTTPFNNVKFNEKTLKNDVASDEYLVNLLPADKSLRYPSKLICPFCGAVINIKSNFHSGSYEDRTYDYYKREDLVEHNCPIIDQLEKSLSEAYALEAEIAQINKKLSKITKHIASTVNKPNFIFHNGSIYSKNN